VNQYFKRVDLEVDLISTTVSVTGTKKNLESISQQREQTEQTDERRSEFGILECIANSQGPIIF